MELSFTTTVSEEFVAHRVLQVTLLPVSLLSLLTLSLSLDYPLSLPPSLPPSLPLSLPLCSGQHNDARMNLAIALTAAREGATVANHVAAVGLIKVTIHVHTCFNER